MQGYNPEEECTNITRVKIRDDGVVKFQNFVNALKMLCLKLVFASFTRYINS
jgi:hypothetical protein